MLEVKQLDPTLDFNRLLLEDGSSTRRPLALGAIPPVRPSGSNGWSAMPVTPLGPHRCNSTSTQVCSGRAKHRVT